MLIDSGTPCSGSNASIHACTTAASASSSGVNDRAEVSMSTSELTRSGRLTAEAHDDLPSHRMAEQVHGAVADRLEHHREVRHQLLERVALDASRLGRMAVAAWSSVTTCRSDANSSATSVKSSAAPLKPCTRTSVGVPGRAGAALHQASSTSLTGSLCVAICVIAPV